MKVQLAGAAAALISGVMLGGFMQPNLGETRDGPAGPQMFADWAGSRSTGPFDPGTTFVAYQANMPDYVMGTDWKKRMAWPEDRAAVSAPRETVSDEAPAQEPAPVITRTSYQELDSPARSYPSLGGARSANDVAVSDDSVATDPASPG